MDKAILIMDMPSSCEEWKDIIGYEGIYQVSNFGRVRNKDKILKPSKSGRYRHLALCKNGTRKDMNIHRLVAEAFIPNPYNYPCINHIDENTMLLAILNGAITDTICYIVQVQRNYQREQKSL